MKRRELCIRSVAKRHAAKRMLQPASALVEEDVYKIHVRAS